MVKKLIKRHLNVNKLETLEFKREELYHILWSSKPEKCGVYWLIRDDKIVYAGFSTNLKKRIKQHASFSSTNKKHWNKVICVVVEDPLKARSIENALIIKFKPEYNSPKTWENFKEPADPELAYFKYLNNIRYVNKLLKVKYAEYDMNKEKKQKEQLLVEIKENQKHLATTFDKWYKNHMLMIKGEPHELYIGRKLLS